METLLCNIFVNQENTYIFLGHWYIIELASSRRQLGSYLENIENGEELEWHTEPGVVGQVSAK